MNIFLADVSECALRERIMFRLRRSKKSRLRTELLTAKKNRFVSLDGVWKIGACQRLQDADIGATLHREIPVPSCVQMHGYDYIQYINNRYTVPTNRLNTASIRR